MSDISTGVKVTGIAQYKSAMNQAAQSVKTLDAQLKQTEASYKANGDREKYMADKAKLLEDKLKAQKTAAKNAQQALKQMKDQGVDPMSQAYQKMQQQLAQAETGVLETSAAINTLGQSEQQAAQGADQLTASVQGISKKISLQQVIGGIDKITGGLENAAKKAVELGKALWDEVISQAEKADNIATNAMIYGLTSEEYQRMQKVADTIGETSVEAIVNAQSRLNYGLGKNSDKTLEALKELKVATKELKDTGGGILEYVDKDAVDIFWEAGEAMMKLGDVTEQQAAAQDIFGRGWKELRPLFNMGREAYEDALSEQNVLSDEGIQKLAELHDAYVKYQGDIETLEQKIMTGMAPALTAGTEALDGLLTRLLEYLDTPEGQAMLERLEESISGLFENLSDIDPESVVENFVTVFNRLVSSFEWIEQHWNDVENGLKAIVGVWAGGKVVSGALTIIELINGLKGLTGGGTGGGAAVGASARGLGGIGGKLLATGAGVGLTGTAAAIGSTLTMLDPTGLTALIPSVLEDQTAFLRTLRNGGSLEEAAAESGKAIEQAFEGAKKSWSDWFDDIVNVPKELAKSVWKDLFGGNNNEPTAEVKVEPKTDEEAAAMISAQIGTVSVPVKLVIQGGNGAASFGGGASGGGGLKDYYWETTWGGFRPGFANGLPFVPFDGYPAVLHKGERVLTAQANKNYTYNNHNYFGSVNLNNGTQVDQLADAIARQTRKQSAGYGG